MKKYYITIKCLALTCLTSLTYAQQIAFPGAEGYGRFTTGGRGGVVYEVTNLTDAGAGSLRYGIESVSGARTIFFRVSGTIEITKNLQIKNGDLTIAGQTAPGDGICIKTKKLVVPSTALTSVVTISSYSVSVDADNVIIRYIRFRPGDEIDNSVGAPLTNIKFENDGLTGRQHKNIIIDHCSMSWAIDEVSSFYDNTNFTMQWCLIGESLYHSFHPKGDHGYGGIWGGMGASFHHNLIADHTSRNPRFCGARYHCVFPQSGCSINLPASTEIVDYRNNVIFNWAGNSAYGGEGGQQNMVNNYYKQGPGTKKLSSSLQYRIVNPSVSTDPEVDSISKWYLKGNFVEGYPAVSNDNANGGGFQPQYANPQGLWAIVSNPFPIAPVTSQTAQNAYNAILDNCGASLYRDTVDKRLIYQVKTGTATTGGTFGANTGIIDSPSQVGGWPTLNSITSPVDSDHDGMPDSWETTQGLNPNDASDRNNVGSDGYTMLEKYINSLTNTIITTQYVLTTSTIGSGSVTPATGSFAENTCMTLSAIPQTGWTFTGWSGDTTCTGNPIVLTMNKNKTITASFTQVTTSVPQLSKTDLKFGCRPNPAEHDATVYFTLSAPALVNIDLFDVTGKQLLTITSSRYNAGYNEISFDMSHLKSGIYFCKLTIGERQFTDRIAILKQ
ncbi:MAG TPA: T9SS type A sorting domain-containing protein [Bacteroidales bacterium]